jgi:hypothetical protein
MCDEMNVTKIILKRKLNIKIIENKKKSCL